MGHGRAGIARGRGQDEDALSSGFTKYSMRRAMSRAAKSLKEPVGPRSSRMMSVRRQPSPQGLHSCMRPQHSSQGIVGRGLRDTVLTLHKLSRDRILVNSISAKGINGKCSGSKGPCPGPGPPGAPLASHALGWPLVLKNLMRDIVDSLKADGLFKLCQFE